MTLNYRRVIFAFLLLILATNLEETQAAKRKHKRSEEKTKDDGASSPAESGSGSGKIEDKEDDVGSGNKTASSSQDERGKEKAKGDNDDATKNKDKGNTTLIVTRSRGGNRKRCIKGKAQGRPDQGNPPRFGRMGCSNHTQPTEGPTDEDADILEATKGPTDDDGVTEPSEEPTHGDANITQTSERRTNNDDVTPPTEEPTDDDDHDYSGSIQSTEKPTEDDNGGIQPTEPLGKDDGDGEETTKKPRDDEDDGGSSTQPTEKPTDNEDNGSSTQPTGKPTHNEDDGSSTVQPTLKPTDNEDDGSSTQPAEKPTDNEDDGSSVQPTLKPTDNEDDGSSTQPTENPTDNEDDDGGSTQPTEKPTDNEDDGSSTQPTEKPTDNEDDGRSTQPTEKSTDHEDDGGSTQPTEKRTHNEDDGSSTQLTEKPTDNEDDGSSIQPTEKPTDNEDDGSSIQPTEKPTDNEDDGSSTQPTEKPTDDEDDGSSTQPTEKPTDSEDDGSSTQPTGKSTDNEDDGGSTQLTEKPTDDDTGVIQPTAGPADDDDVIQSEDEPVDDLNPTKAAIDGAKFDQSKNATFKTKTLASAKDSSDKGCSVAMGQPKKCSSTTRKPPAPPQTVKTNVLPDKSKTVSTTEGTTAKVTEALTTGTETSTTGTTEASATRTTKPTTREASTTGTTVGSTIKTTTEASTTGTTKVSTTEASITATTPTTETTEASTTGTTKASTTEASITATTPTTEGTTKRLRDGSAEKAKETLQAYEKNIDAKNKTQIQTVLTSFKKILSSDESTKPKLKDDILAVKLLENVGKTIASQLKPTQAMPASIGEITNEQVFGVVAMRGMNNSGFNFPDQITSLRNASSFPARINLPSAVLNNNTSSNLSLVFMIYTASSEMQSRTGSESYNVTGKVVLASMFPKPTFPFQEPVVITIQNPEKNFSKASLTSVCVYLVENSSTQNTSLFGAWSNQGCKLAYTNQSHSVCHCYHLTNFAILTRFSAQKIPKEHELALSIITYIGLSLSIFGCLATLFVHFMLPKLWTDRTFIHMNLVTALGIANIVFLFQKLPVVGSAGCTTLAFILLYFYLAAFSWMMLEGIHIYRMLVKVFDSGKDPRKSYFAAGWGIPMLLVVITVAIFRDDVTSEYYCWLSATNGAFWMFAGPVCLVIFVNTAMLLVVMRTSLHHHSKQDKHLKRSMAKTFCILLPVLGITWLIGLVTFNKDIIEMQYIFAIVNSLQGFFIFLFYVVFSVEVRREITHKLEIWKTEKEIYDQAQMTRESKLRYSEQTNSLNQLKH